MRSSCADPTHVIGLYPDLLPSDYRRQLHYPNPLPALSGAELEKAHLALIDYLTQVCVPLTPPRRWGWHGALPTLLLCSSSETQPSREAPERLRPLHHLPPHGRNPDHQKPQEASADHRHHAAAVLPARKDVSFLGRSSATCRRVFIFRASTHANPDDLYYVIKVKDGIKEKTLMGAGSRTKDAAEAKWTFFMQLISTC